RGTRQVKYGERVSRTVGICANEIRAHDRRWGSKTLSSSDKLQALGNVYARRPAQMSKFGSPRPHGGTRTAIRRRRCRRNLRSAECFLSDSHEADGTRCRLEGITHQL